MNKKRLKIDDINRINNRNKQAKLHHSIMENLKPLIKKMIKESECDDLMDDVDIDECDTVEEGELNELFGFGSSVKKPEKALSVENSDDENATPWTDAGCSARLHSPRGPPETAFR